MRKNIETNDFIWLKPENKNGSEELIEAVSLGDNKIYYPPIPVYKRVIDFIKSWFYYSKLKKYAFEQGGFLKSYISNTGRFQYAWWHCRKGMYNVWWGR